MSDRDEFDQDEELRALLRAGDPSASLAPADARALAGLVDEVTHPRVAEGSPRRGPVAWLVGAAAAAVVVTAGVGAVHQLGGHDTSPTAGQHRDTTGTSTPSGSQSADSTGSPDSTGTPAVSRLSLAPGSLDARCAAPNATMLAATDTAFSGTVTRIDGNRVTIERAVTFHGAVADTVTITAPPAEFGQLVQAVRFTVGRSYLVSAYRGQLAVCGFSGPAGPSLQQLYTEAFPPLSARGLVLAAGAGSRMGMPKALVRFPDGTPWLRHAVQVLEDGGCDGITVVLGASAGDAVGLLDGLGVDVVVAHDWADGMSASLRAGLGSLASAPEADCALVTLVDLPDLTAAVVRRVLTEGERSDALARASYDGRPGHPVLLGRDHWGAVIGTTSGGPGAREYLAWRDTTLVECGDLATGRDVDQLDRSASG